MAEVLVDVRHLTYRFPLNKKMWIQALDDVSFHIRKGEVFGLVGESGSGKSTAARCIMNIHQVPKGHIFYQGIDTGDPGQYRANRQALRIRRQYIFQDSASSLNPRMRIGDIIAEPLSLSHTGMSRKELRTAAQSQMLQVGLDPSYLRRYPPELSGGQRQRAAIARALSVKPEFLVADEPVASLDVSIQAQIMNLFRRLHKDHGFTFLLIAHDLAMVEFLCDRVGVLYRGRLVETAPVRELFNNPRHGYTKALLSAIPIPDPRRERARKLTLFEPCELGAGRLREVSPEHFVYTAGEEGGALI